MSPAARVRPETDQGNSLRDSLQASRVRTRIIVGDELVNSDVLVALIGSATTVLVASGGWCFAWMLHRDSKARERQERRIEKLQEELIARIVHEQKANEWLAEVTKLTPRAVMLELRKRVEKEIGRRPQMTLREASDGQQANSR
jgi:hypothetical protein